jgi:hypothetical protein
MSTSQHVIDAINGYRAMFAAVGLTKTADTGQLATPPVPATMITSVTLLGYDVFTWDDGYGALYMKWEVWWGTSAPGNGYYRVTVGTGTDGAGNITGVLLNGMQTSGNVASVGSQENFISRSGTCLTIAIQGTVNYFHMLTIDRQRDPVTGVPIAGSYFFGYAKTNQDSDIKMITPATGWTVSYNVGGNSAKSPTHPLGYSGATGMGLETYKIDLVPIFGWYAAGFCIQPGIMTFNANEITWQSKHEFDAVVYGQTRHYKAISTKLFASNSTALCGWAMLWE